MKAIQKELGDSEEGRDELAEIEEKIDKTKLSKEAREKATGRAEEAPPDEPDVGRGHRRAQLPRLAAAHPVGASARSRSDLNDAAGDPRRGPFRPREGQGAHPRVSRRAAARRTRCKGPILCLVGPPGVGKTSLGKSIARATGTQIRAHVSSAACATRPRSAATGAPTSARCRARSSSRMKQGEDARTRCSCSTRSTRSAPTSAATRPRRCSRCSTRSRITRFNDHYLEVDYDLSNVMFITTANTLRMPPAADGPHGDHPHRRATPRTRRSRSRAPPDPEADSRRTG